MRKKGCVTTGGADTPAAEKLRNCLRSFGYSRDWGNYRTYEIWYSQDGLRSVELFFKHGKVDQAISWRVGYLPGAEGEPHRVIAETFDPEPAWLSEVLGRALDEVKT
jgi:hypothetical protein